MPEVSRTSSDSPSRLKSRPSAYPDLQEELERDWCVGATQDFFLGRNRRYNRDVWTKANYDLKPRSHLCCC